MYMDSHCHLDPKVYGGDDAVDVVVERAKKRQALRKW